MLKKEVVASLEVSRSQFLPVLRDGRLHTSFADVNYSIVFWPSSCHCLTASFLPLPSPIIVAMTLVATAATSAAVASSSAASAAAEEATGVAVAMTWHLRQC